MPRGGDRSAKVKASGKKQGRPPKPKIDLDATLTKDISERVFARPEVNEEALWVEYLHVGKKLDDMTDRSRAERQWALDRLTNRRYGLPAQQIIAGGKIIFEVVELGANRSSA